MASPTLTTASRPTVSRLTLTAMVVGSMVGGGVFSLPQRFASGTGVIGAVIGLLGVAAGAAAPAFP